MGKIVDQLAAVGRQIEAELAVAKKLPAPVPGPAGPPGPPGPAGDTTPTTAKYDILTAADGHATGFAQRHGISITTLKALNPDGPPSGNWDLVHAGERYRYA